LGIKKVVGGKKREEEDSWKKNEGFPWIHSPNEEIKNYGLIQQPTRQPCASSPNLSAGFHRTLSMQYFPPKQTNKQTNKHKSNRISMVAPPCLSAILPQCRKYSMAVENIVVLKTFRSTRCFSFFFFSFSSFFLLQ